MNSLTIKETKKITIEVPYEVIHCLNLNILKNYDSENYNEIENLIRYSSEIGILFSKNNLSDDTFINAILRLISSTKKSVSEFVSLEDEQEKISAVLESIYNTIFVIVKDKKSLISEVEISAK